MFSINDGRSDRNCEGYLRRSFLRIGALGLGTLTLADLLAFRARAIAEGAPVKVTSVILQTLFDPGAIRLERYIPPAVSEIIAAGEPISELV